MQEFFKHICSTILALTLVSTLYAQELEHQKSLPTDSVATEDIFLQDSLQVSTPVDTLSINNQTLVAPLDSISGNTSDSLSRAKSHEDKSTTKVNTPLKEESVEEVALGEDSTKFEFAIGSSFIAIYIDYGKLLFSALPTNRKYEFGLVYNLLGRINIYGEYGYGKLEPQNAINNGPYTSEGTYYRGGADYFIEIVPRKFLGLGFAYASAEFVDSGNILIKSDLWGDLNQHYENTDLSASWYEVNLTSEGKMFNTETSILSGLWLGAKFKLKVMNKYTDSENFDINAIPGYGRTFKNTALAFNLFLKYKINL